MVDLYPETYSSIRTTALFPASTRAAGIDLRAEMHKILFGTPNQAPQGHYVLLRSMNSVCPCITEENRGQVYRTPDPKCSICRGVGYIYTDTVYTAWRSLINSGSGQLLGTLIQGQPGISTVLGFNFFFEYSVPIKEIDRIIELRLGPDGSLPTTLDRINQLEEFKIIQLVPYRGDNGRLEFQRCICSQVQW